MSEMHRTNTTLWKTSLGQESVWGHDHLREKLSASFDTFRSNANVLASQIAHDLPDFTNHDQSHLDSLWETASLIAGPNYVLNPIESFVFGGAVLLHDLGHSVAAYVDGVKSLQSHAKWDDILEIYLREFYKRIPTEDERGSYPEEVKKKTIGHILRLLHAEHAERLLQIRWKHDENEFRLLEDSELLEHLGDWIGLIAASHWWPIEEVVDKLDLPLGSPPNYPYTWGVDLLKIACLLRVADAAHIDSRRAPSFLNAIRKPNSYSQLHWTFQSRLARPVTQDEQLVYTSTRAFKETDMQSWWLGYDLLRLVDKELRGVDNILKEKHRSPFLAKGVKGVGNPQRLMNHIRVIGWEPIDAQIKVTDLPRLVKHLGGEGLYGKKPYIPLRELIQNACDAIEARRRLEGEGQPLGKIIVRLSKDIEGVDWIEIEDNGVGMSKSVLSDKLLDFGSSFWGNQSVMEEHPGLLSSGFKPTGKFGIGFFSVFMWGESIQVISRSIHGGPKDTHVLEFDEGLNKRPTLRKGGDGNLLRNPGTIVKVRIADNSILKDIAKSLINSYKPEEFIPSNIEDLLKFICRRLAPSIESDLYVQIYKNPPVNIINSGDWRIIEAESLLLRIAGFDNQDAPNELKEFVSEFAPLLKPIYNSEGIEMGRALIIPEFRFMDDLIKLGNLLHGVSTCGGLYMDKIDIITGIICSEVDRASRFTGEPLVSHADIAIWASEQAKQKEKYQTIFNEDDRLSYISLVVAYLGGDTGKLPICMTKDGWLNYSQVKNTKWPNTVKLFHSFNNLPFTDLELTEDLIIIATYSDFAFIHGRNVPWSSPSYSGIRELIIEAIAESWGVDVEKVIERSRFAKRTGFNIDAKTKMLTIDVEGNTDIIQNPNAT